MISKSKILVMSACITQKMNWSTVQQDFICMARP